VYRLELSSRGRRQLMLGVAMVGGLLLAQSVSQVAAVILADGGRREALELAAKVDPGSYRIRMLLAEQWRAAGRCDRAAPHAQRARELLPNHPAPRAVLRACGVRR
jgi:hypothetical protein